MQNYYSSIDYKEQKIKRKKFRLIIFKEKRKITFF